MMPDPRVKDFGEIETKPLFDMVVDLDPRLDFGLGPVGQRVLFGSAGGSFAGERLKGEVLRGGGDWTLFRLDGVMTLDVRLTLRTHDGQLIFMTYGGRWVVPNDVRAELNATSERHSIDPARYYFRTNPLFETGSEDYAWINNLVCIGKGYLVEGGVAYQIFEVG